MKVSSHVYLCLFIFPSTTKTSLKGKQNFIRHFWYFFVLFVSSYVNKKTNVDCVCGQNMNYISPLRIKILNISSLGAKTIKVATNPGQYLYNMILVLYREVGSSVLSLTVNGLDSQCLHGNITLLFQRKNVI